jgi:ankyrin repeat protein
MRFLTRSAAFAACAVVASVNLAAANGDTRLATAARNRDAKAVQSLLQLKADVNASQPGGATALHWAAHWDELATADLLLKAGANPNAANDYGITPLLLAATNGSAALIQRLLAAGANPNAAQMSGQTPLMTAARGGSVNAVNLLVAAGADVNAREKFKGQNALMWALAEHQSAAARALIEHGADIRAPTAAGSTPLMFAAREDNMEIARLLLDKGASLKETAKDGTTPLHVATTRAHVELAKFFLDRGADPNANGPGYTPLHWAAGRWETLHTHDYPVPSGEWSTLIGLPREQQLDLIKALLAHGADINARATQLPPRFGYTLSSFITRYATGATPFFLAAMSADAELMRFLAANGANPTIAAGVATTALMAAAGRTLVPGESKIPEQDHLEAVKASLDLGADINGANGDGWTALHGAAYAGFDTIVQYLADKGASINARNQNGDTPLKIAEGFVFPNMVNIKASTAELLRKLGGVSNPGPPPRVNEEPRATAR